VTVQRATPVVGRGLRSPAGSTFDAGHRRRRYAAVGTWADATSLPACLREVGLALDDDDIGGRLGINLHYVNQVCRELARAGIITRKEGSGGKLVKRWAGGDAERPQASVAGRAVVSRPRRRRAERARSNVDALIDDFPGCVLRFERSNAFPGPSLYFHQRAIERRRVHASVNELMADQRFFEYVYAVLPAWGMHRMGKQAAKVGDFGAMVHSFRAQASAIGDLWDLHICTLPEDGGDAVAEQVWAVLGSLKVSTSATRIVAGSKALHHALPELVPPIDRQYTFQFFTGQKAVNSGDEQAFLEWFPYLAEIGRRAADDIQEALDRRGFMATSAAKVVDNAIVGFMQRDAGNVEAGE
jgi:hypothetical protein